MLLYLATHTEHRVTIAEIANFFTISHEHLRKIIHCLSKAQYIQTYLGRNGGMALLKEPDMINLKDVFLTFESNQVIQCHTKGCTLMHHCTLQIIFNQANIQFLEVLANYSLADLINDKRMQESLSLPIEIR